MDDRPAVEPVRHDGAAELSGYRLTGDVLGPFEVSLDRGPVTSTGQPVSVNRLVGTVWRSHPPTHGRRIARTYITRLCRILDAGIISTAPTGHVLRIDRDQVDALRFVRLLDRGRT